jgi:hypothetical protein
MSSSESTASASGGLGASPHFVPVSLAAAANARRDSLPDSLRAPVAFAAVHGERAIRGVPFLFGGPEGPEVVLLDGDEAVVELGGARASYVLFLHAVEDVVTEYRQGFADPQVDGLGLGELVSEYALEYEDGAVHPAPIHRRFAIQQARYGWGSAPFACVAAAEEEVFPSAEEMQLLGDLAVGPLEQSAGSGADSSARDLIGFLYGLQQQSRTNSAINGGLDPASGGLLWIYALPSPRPDRPLRRVVCRGRGERSVVYAVTLTELESHPLRRESRRKLRVPLPDGAEFNPAGELEGVRIDLGTVISARPVLGYDAARWAGPEPVVEPLPSRREAIVEFAAHPQARLRVGETVYELGEERAGSITVAPSDRPVKLRFLESGSPNPVPVRLHLHGEHGEYLPPRGHQRRANPLWWGGDTAAEFVNGENQYAYVDGECIADLPLGTVFVEATRGYEVTPLRRTFEVDADTEELVLELERVLDWRRRGWVTADTHVHFLSPQTALLEGRAEGVNVVNLLAAQWGEMFSNVGDFDGATTIGAAELGGSGEFLVRVGSENRMNVLGHISLLGYSGELIHPLSTGGPGESAAGDPLEVTMAEWAQRCIDQSGLVVMPHAPTPQLERAADIVLGLVGAIELVTFNPLRPAAGDSYGQLNPYGLADWYRYLNLGYQVPLVGGSDKMSTGMLLGGIRTYVQLAERELTYENWMQAIRAGNTFATVGPLATIAVEGIEPGGTLRLPAGGGTVRIEWEAESAALPIDRVEIVVGGLVAAETTVGALAARGDAAIAVTDSTWVALRVRGSYSGEAEDIAAHTSAVQVLVGDSELFSEPDSIAVLDQIQGALAYVDTIATRPDGRRLRALRATLEGAYNRLHQRMHAAGVYHRHLPHDPAEPHEH